MLIDIESCQFSHFLFHLSSPQTKHITVKMIFKATTNLCKQSYLESEGDDCDDDGDNCVQHEVEQVGDCPVCPARQPILLHHYEMFLRLILHQHSHIHLRGG